MLGLKNMMKEQKTTVKSGKSCEKYTIPKSQNVLYYYIR